MSTSSTAKPVLLAQVGSCYLSYVKTNGELLWQSGACQPHTLADIIDVLSYSHAELLFYNAKPEESADVFRGIAAVGPLPFLIFQTRIDLSRTNGISAHHAALRYNQLRSSGHIAQPKSANLAEVEGR